jgi:hypothetical protein
MISSLVLISRVVVDYIKVVINDVSCRLVHLIRVLNLWWRYRVMSISVVISLVIMSLVNVFFLSLGL